LYFRCHRENINGERVVEFLRYLLRHLRGHIVLLWDGGTIHRKEIVKSYLLRNPRLRVHRFPAYAPELNPDEHIWTQAKHALANSAPDNVDQLDHRVNRVLLGLQRSPNLLWSCIDVADLPWK
jgi:transposase